MDKELVSKRIIIPSILFTVLCVGFIGGFLLRSHELSEQIEHLRTENEELQQALENQIQINHELTQQIEGKQRTVDKLLFKLRECYSDRQDDDGGPKPDPTPEPTPSPDPTDQPTTSPKPTSSPSPSPTDSPGPIPPLPPIPECIPVPFFGCVGAASAMGLFPGMVLTGFVIGRITSHAD